VSIQVSSLRKRRYLSLFGALLVVVAIEWGIRTWKTADDPTAVYRSISEQRHSHPAEALTKAKGAEAGAKTKPSWRVWEQRFRLLYADILIEQNSPLSGKALSDVVTLLTFQPENRENATRLLAARAYLELKRSGGDYKIAKKINEEALERNRANPINDPCWSAEVLLHYAQTLIYLNDDGTRDPLLNAELEAESCSDPYWRTLVPFTTGNFHLNSSRYKEAQVSFEKALSYAQSYKFPSLVSLTSTNLALAYTDMGDFDKALGVLGRAKGSSESDKARILSISAFVHNLRGENDAALRDYLRAVEILQLSKPEDYYAYLEELAAVLIEMNRLDEAERYSQEVIQHADPNGHLPWIVKTAKFNAASIARLRGNLKVAHDQLMKLRPSLKQETDAEVIWRLHGELAQTFAAMGRNKEADGEFSKAVETASKARQQLDSDQDRMTFSIYVERLVSRYIDFVIDRGAEPPASLKLAETFRAQRLAEKLNATNTPAPERFQTIARSRQALILSYWVTHHRSYLWATTARGTKVFLLNGLENLVRDIENHNLQIYGEGDLLQTPKLATELYEKLVAPAESLIQPGSNVIIVPSGPLAALNFETLIPPARPAQYWLNNVSVTVAPSLSVLGDETNLKGRPRRFLLVGDTIPKGQKPLPGSVSELKDLARLFPSANTVQLTGTNATPEHFLQSHPGNSSLLHISSHASANKESPLDSYIMLTPDATHSDGYLYAHDLMKLRLSEELVTLSACEGAGGKTLPGEGQVGLTWAILSAGAHKVLASSFKVSDHATASFMRDFYTRLAAGNNPAKALHDTKVALASQSAVPYFWAAFQLYTR
jgi:CHAT domain-containing protein